MCPPPGPLGTVLRTPKSPLRLARPVPLSCTVSPCGPACHAPPPPAPAPKSQAQAPAPPPAPLQIGGSIAALRVRFQGSGERVKLADLRRGRGRARRVVLVAASAAGLREAVAAAAPLSAKLVECDLLVVPVTLPLGGPAADLDAAATALDHIALPAEGEWVVASPVAAWGGG